METHTLFFIPIRELTVTNPTGSLGGPRGLLFPNGDVANSLARDATNRGKFTWDGDGGYHIQVSDDDANFNDDNDSTQRLAAPAEGYPTGTPVEL